MKKILVCQHVAHELLGTLNPLLKSAGFRIRYINFGRHPDATPTLDGYEGLIVLGGPMNVDETDRYPHLNHEIGLIEQAMQNNLPVLGICLGGQLIAKALGAPVTKNRVKEIGWYDVSLTTAGEGDPFFGGFGKTEKMFQWHGDTFAIPSGAVHLARSADCAHQAFRYGDKVYALQFHLEVDERMVERWFKVAGNKKELEDLKGLGRAIDPAQIIDQTPAYIHRLKELGQKAFGRFTELFGPCTKYRWLPSR